MVRRIPDYEPLAPSEAQPATLNTALSTLGTFVGANSPQGYTAFVFTVDVDALTADTVTFYIEHTNDGTNWARAQGVVAGSNTGEQGAGDLAIIRANTQTGERIILQTFTTSRGVRLRGITAANAGTVTVSGERIP